MPNLPRRAFLEQIGSASLMAAAAQTVTVAAEQRPRPRIKIGQIGTAHAHASGKMQTMRSLSDLFEVVGVAEPDDALRSRAESASAYRDVPWLTERELLDSPGLQVVAVETAVNDLVRTAQQCIDANVHVHLDKPAGESLDPFAKLLADATRRKRVVQMGYMFRYNPAFQFLFRAVREGWLGQVFEVHGVISKTVDSPRRKQLQQYPGAMFELGCHLIDALVALLGKPATVLPFTRRTRPDQDHLNDNCLAVFEYPRATATIRSSLVEVEGQRRRQFVVCGDKGTIAIKPLEPPVLELTLDQARPPFKKGAQPVEIPRLEGRYDGDFRDLAKIIRGEKTADFSPEHDLATHEAILLASGE